jgi:hypothetical protein
LQIVYITNKLKYRNEVVLVVIGFVGYGVYKNYHKTDLDKVATSKTGSGITSNLYAGWDMAALKYEKISFRYPPSWVLDNGSLAYQNITTSGQQEACVYPGEDGATLTASDGSQIQLFTPGNQDGCVNESSSGQVASTPITTLGKKLFISFVYMADPYSGSPQASEVNKACISTSASSYDPPESQNIFEDTVDKGLKPENLFCFITPPDVNNESIGESLSVMEQSSDFTTAKLVFESMMY